MNLPNAPLPLSQPPELIDPELATLITEPFAETFVRPAGEIGDQPLGTPPERTDDPVRTRLMARIAASRAQSRTMFTARRSQLACEPLSDGVRAQTLYLAPAGQPSRPGEPLRARLIELQPGGSWSGPESASHREWLVIDGMLRIGGENLHRRDYHVQPAGSPADAIGSDEGALVFLRESTCPALPGDEAFTIRDQEAGWPDYAPGIRRRVLWQRDSQAALLYFTDPGASVPAHRHGHDEECLMVQGELFLDDVLLQAGDYQLAPAGSGHVITQTDTGVVIYAHGDLDLQFVG